MHSERCSFCLVARGHVGYLVATETVSICDRCVARQRKPTVLERVRAWFVPSREEHVGLRSAAPHRRDERVGECSFCLRSIAPLIHGDQGRICEDCLSRVAGLIAQRPTP